MKKVLYILCKPQKRLKVNLSDFLLLVNVALTNTPYYIIGRLFSLLALIINYLGYYMLEDVLDAHERRILLSTCVIIGLFLIYVTIIGI